MHDHTNLRFSRAYVCTYTFILTDTLSRSDAANVVKQALEPTFLDACSHPVRVAIIRRLVAIGASDISELSKPFQLGKMPRDNQSALRERANITISEKRGRHVI